MRFLLNLRRRRRRARMIEPDRTPLLVQWRERRREEQARAAYALVHWLVE